MNKLFAICAFAVTCTLSGCKVTIISTEGGTVASQSGTRDCEADMLCNFEITSLGFSETFMASANPGYEFVEWHKGDSFLCGGSTNPSCQVTFPDDASLSPILTSLLVQYAMPIYKHVGIDTDNDGTRDALDNDDDNDGTLDLDDLCPLDADPNCGYLDVGGKITADTVWTAESGIVRLTSGVSLDPDVSLTIEEGARVMGQGNYLECFGANLRVNGETGRLIALESILIIGAACKSLKVEYAHFIGTNEITSPYSVLTVRNSRFEGQTIIETGRDSAFGQTYIENNAFMGNAIVKLEEGAEGWDGSNIFIRNNSFSGYSSPVISGSLSSASIPGTLDPIPNQHIYIEHNSFLEAGTATLAIDYVSWPSPVYATNNYWNTTNEDIIQGMVFDQSDLANDEIEFLPYLLEPSPGTPTAP